MEIKIKDKNGITLTTKDKICEEDIKITFDKRLLEQDHTNEDGLITRTLTSYSNNRVSKIGDRVFYGYTGLISVSFPVATSVGANSFNGCSSLKDVYLPNASSIGGQAFYSCTSLLLINLPQTTNLQDQCFRYCSALRVVYVPKLKAIIGATFANCTAIEAIVITQTDSVATLGTSTCFNSSSIASGTGYIYVPDDLVDSYKIATNWSVYATQIKGLSELPQEIREELGL